MTADNREQIEIWNTTSGQRWADEQVYLDDLLAAFATATLDAAAPSAGEKGIDVGCGCGATTLALADAVGAGGEALGVDVSAQMLDVARARVGGRTQLGFVEADASNAPLPGGRDLLISRFGVMFFADPTAAFTHMRTSLKPGGRVAFACWRPMSENPWVVVPLMAAIQATGVVPKRPEPDAPGPFAFGDAARVRAILSGAGFVDIALTAFDAPMPVGASATDAAAHSIGIGPLAAVVREAEPARRAAILEAVTGALAAYETPVGVVMQGATWIVTARSP